MKKQIAKTAAITKFSEAYGFLNAQQDEQMGLIFGQPGTGKTTAGEYLAAQFDGLFFQMQPNMTANALCVNLLDLLAISAASSFNANLNRLIKKLALRQSTLFLDEADYLFGNDYLLSVVRTIHDQAKIPVILIGMTGIQNKLAQQRLLFDRIQYFLEIPLCSLEDTQLIASARCEIKIMPDLLQHIHTSTKGNARQIKRILAHVENFAAGNGLKEISLSQWGERSLLPNNSTIPSKSRRA